MFYYEGKNSIYLGGQARLIETDREVAAEGLVDRITPNPAYAWIVGRFAEAERANRNKQYFTLGDLRLKNPTLLNAPMNIDHSQRNVVGTFVHSELVYPEEPHLNPYIEAVGAFWKYYFPQEYATIRRLHEEGTLFYSMEALPEYLSTIGGSDDNARYPYRGIQHESYPDEINHRTCDAVVLNNPHFVGGALVTPPNKPGWDFADVEQVAKYLEETWQHKELEDQIANHDFFGKDQWELMMEELTVSFYTEVGREFNSEQRKKLAKSGAAMPDGSFPIVNEQDLKNAIQAIGRAKDPAKARAHIKKRAKALGKSDLIPEGW